MTKLCVYVAASALALSIACTRVTRSTFERLHAIERQLKDGERQLTAIEQRSVKSHADIAELWAAISKHENALSAAAERLRLLEADRTTP